MQNRKSPQTKWAYDVIKAKLYDEDLIPHYSNFLNHTKAGCFVSLHTQDGSLRGCIGSIYPNYQSLEEEIKHNALLAAFNDYRFEPLKKNELESLEISVDVLETPELIHSIDDLNPKEYGVIVVHGNKRGVLLPDLPGVEDVYEQIGIAKKKANISDGESINIYRFRVTRFH